MGMCFSKKKLLQNGQPPSPTRSASSQPTAPKHLPRRQTETAEAVATTPSLTQQQSQAVPAAAPGSKKQIFGTTPSSINNIDEHGGRTEEVKAAATATAAAETEKTTKSTAAANASSSKQPSAPEEDPQVAAATVRTSSCSKEEVESILIQCGRLSRNSSGAESRHHRSRKRSYDFDCGERNVDDEDEEEREKPSFSRPSPHRHRHRRTPSRDGDNSEHKRSGSRERGSGSSAGRRTSRSPGRRSDTQLVASSSSNTSSTDRSRQPPGKMVSVPAREKTTTVPSEVGCGMSVRKATTAAPLLSAAVDGGNKRSSSEVGGLRSASPRTRSPANPTRSCTNENTHSQLHLPPQQPQSLSRSSSRKTEQSPYRRNPMAEVDGNILSRMEQPPPPKANLQMQNDNKMQSTSKKADEGTRKPLQSSQQQQLRGGENTMQMRRQDIRNGAAAEVTSAAGDGNNTARGSVREKVMSCRVKEHRQERQPATENLAVDQVLLPTTGSGAEVPNPTALTRTRSSRRSSKDLDANPCFNPAETLLKPASYASLLLEDIHNYHHHKNAPSFSLPACVSKACSILEAVADLNSSSSAAASGNSKVPEADRSHASVNGSCHHYYINDGAGTAKMTTAGQIQFVESDLAVAEDEEDLTKPSLRKYNVSATAMARDPGVDLEPQESAGSNSFVGQPWASPREPNSADSSDRCWTSSWSNNGAGDDAMGRGLEEFIGASDNHQKQRHHLKQQQHHRSLGGGFEASGRRSRSGAAASASAAASMMSNSSSRGRGGSK
ncbi:hypothetical protein Taro_037969 [Colocasia esculenta]|uniref:Uncharacterized protein n=1 Tax=Colocasia esculenta TaxID=4460 RepID=A0A843WHT7_COLES|nr:hypothetical protein [Colocasia esculenta]